MYKLTADTSNEVYTYIRDKAKKIKRDKNALIYIINKYLLKIPNLKTIENESNSDFILYETSNTIIKYSKHVKMLNITINNKKTKNFVLDVGIYASEITRLHYPCITCINENICNKEIKEVK